LIGFVSFKQFSTKALKWYFIKVASDCRRPRSI